MGEFFLDSSPLCLVAAIAFNTFFFEFVVQALHQYAQSAVTTRFCNSSSPFNVPLKEWIFFFPFCRSYVFWSDVHFSPLLLLSEPFDVKGLFPVLFAGRLAFLLFFFTFVTPAFSTCA